VPGTTYSVAGRSEAACEEHDFIIDAIEKRDERLAEEVGRAHVRASFEVRLQIVP
jgi:DNA-binding GntR family transcriptional regulator